MKKIKNKFNLTKIQFERVAEGFTGKCSPKWKYQTGHVRSVTLTKGYIPVKPGKCSLLYWLAGIFFIRLKNYLI